MITMILLTVRSGISHDDDAADAIVHMLRAKIKFAIAYRMRS